MNYIEETRERQLRRSAVQIAAKVYMLLALRQPFKAVVLSSDGRWAILYNEKGANALSEGEQIANKLIYQIYVEIANYNVIERTLDSDEAAPEFDARHLEKSMRTLGMTDEQIQKCFARYKPKVAKILDEGWKDIEHLADVLIQKRSLSFADVRKVLTYVGLSSDEAIKILLQKTR